MKAIYVINTVLLVCLSLFTLVNSTRVHTVVRGDTLWDISGHYLQDPFKWPNIWQHNPHIKNPHLIYPGDEVLLESGAPRTAAGGFRRQTLDLKQAFATQAAREGYHLESRMVRSRHLLPDLALKAPFLLKVDTRGKVFQEEATIKFISETDESLLQLYSSIEINRGQDEGVKPGDLYQIYSVGDYYTGFKKSANLGVLVKIQGLVRIQKVRPGISEGKLVQCYGKITPECRVSPYRKKGYAPIGGYKPYPEKTISGQLIYIQQEQAMVLPYSYIIIDQGDGTGFKFGDGVVIYNRDPVQGKPTDRLLGKGIVVRVNSFSSSILVKEIYPGSLNKGDFISASHKALVAKG